MTVEGDAATGGGRSLIGVGNPAMTTGTPAGSGIEEAAIAQRQLALAIEG